MKEIQQYFKTFTDKWTDLGKWSNPDLRDCLDYLIIEAAGAIKARLGLCLFLGEPPHLATVEHIDRKVADTIIWCLLWFILRQQDAEALVISRLEEMDLEKQRSDEDFKKRLPFL